MVALRADGQSYRAIAVALNAEHPADGAVREWRVSSVRRVLEGLRRPRHRE
jgi:hypothetical protein